MLLTEKELNFFQEYSFFVAGILNKPKDAFTI